MPEPGTSGDTVRPFTIVLLGGIASGKSTIAALFQARGAVVLDADRMAHEALAGPDGTAAAVAAFGPGILGEGGTVDRKKVGEIVFRDPVALRKLEAILHPRVRDRVARRLTELATKTAERRRVVILDVPLAAESIAAAGNVGDPLPWSNPDLIVFVDASESVRKARALERRGWTAGELERREANQFPVAEKRRLAGATVKNEGSTSEAESDVERVWSQVVEPRIQAAPR